MLKPKFVKCVYSKTFEFKIEGMKVIALTGNR